MSLFCQKLSCRMEKVKLIVLSQEISETYHVHNSDGGHLEGCSCRCEYVVANKPFDISYNEAAIIKKFDCIIRAIDKSYPDDKISLEFNPIRLNLDFNKQDEWQSYCARFRMEEHVWQGGGIYEVGTEQGWGIAKEPANLLLEELSSCIPDKYELWEVNDINGIIDNSHWRCCFLTLKVDDIYNNYLTESRAGCEDIQNRIFKKKVQIYELEKSIKRIEESIEVDKNDLKEQEKRNLINLLCEKKLFLNTSFPPTLGFENVTPLELALFSGNKQIFVLYFNEGLLKEQNDVLCLLLKHGQFANYNKIKKSFDIYRKHEDIFKRLHVFYAVYHMDVEELFHIANIYSSDKKLIRDFFEKCYRWKKYYNGFDVVVKHDEIRWMIYKDYMKDYKEWAMDVSYGDENKFLLDIENIIGFLDDEYGEEQLWDRTIYYWVSTWFSSRLPPKNHAN